MRALAVALGGLALCACGLPPAESEGIALASRDFGFIDQVYAGDTPLERELSGYLLLPEGSGPFPAVVILHGAQGQGAQDALYAELLRDHGYAALAVDSFSGRGVRRTIEDPTLVSEVAMIADAFAALRLLQEDPRIDDERVALLGFSKGGVAALYSAFDRLAARIAPDGERFAAHAAFYPWCGFQPYQPVTSGRPILIVGGDADGVAPAELCAELLDLVRAADPGAEVEHVVYPGVDHAFDHPMLGSLPFTDSLPVVGLIPTRCRLVESEPGIFSETTSGARVTSETALAVLKGCSSERASVTADPRAALDAQARLLDFLATALR